MRVAAPTGVEDLAPASAPWKAARTRSHMGLVGGSLRGPRHRRRLLGRIPRRLGDRTLLVFLAVIAGYAAGFQLGRMASYGRVGSILRQAGAHLRMTPGHLDGVGGPIGEYFLFQAMVAAS